MDQTDARRDRILDEAAEHFLRDGFERTSMEQIAASARVSKQTIYDVFGNKDLLFEQVIRNEIGQRGHGEAHQDDDLHVDLERHAADLAEAFFRPRHFGLFRANIVATRLFPSLASALHEYRRGAATMLIQRLNELVHGRIIDADHAAVPALATRLGGVAVEGVRHFLGHPPSSDSARAAQVWLATEMFLHGVRGLPAADEPVAHPLAGLPVAATVPKQGTALRLSRERFDALCAAALTEFLEHGFQGASIETILGAVGIARSTVYRQFGNKAGLFRFVVARRIDEVASDTIILSEGDDFEGRMERLSRSILDRHLDPASIALHHLLIREVAEFPDLARDYYDALVARAGQPFAVLVHQQTGGWAAPATVRGFYTLATFGVRYIAAMDPVSEAQRRIVSAEAARIICRGMAR